MSDSEPDAVAWFSLALGDLTVAQGAVEGSSASRRAAAEHAQQAAEKALKASIALDGREPPRTHDLVALRRQLRDPSIIDARIDLDALSDAVQAARYPGPEIQVFDAAEVRRLVDDAEAIVAAVSLALDSAGLHVDAIAPR